MSEIPFIHLAPKDTSRTGIASYADTLHAALTKYAPSLSLIRVDASEFLARLSTFPKGAIVWAELGVNEGEIFRALRLQKHYSPLTSSDSLRFTIHRVLCIRRLSFWSSSESLFRFVRFGGRLISPLSR